MHVPDGYFDVATSIGAGVTAAAAVGICLRGSRTELDERTTPLAGLTAAFVFAVQMLNFPVAFGTSGHLLGGALAAILVGPYTGILCVAIVLAVQALFFADGGLTALGLNVLLISVVPAVVGYFAFRLILRVTRRARASVSGAAFAGAFLSVPAAAAVFVGLYALGGAADVPLDLLVAAMGGIHLLIGVGEGLITALIVSAVLATRPDLVYGARDSLPSSELHTTSGTGPSMPQSKPATGADPSETH